MAGATYTRRRKRIRNDDLSRSIEFDRAVGQSDPFQLPGGAKAEDPFVEMRCVVTQHSVRSDSDSTAVEISKLTRRRDKGAQLVEFESCLKRVEGGDDALDTARIRAAMQTFKRASFQIPKDSSQRFFQSILRCSCNTNEELAIVLAYVSCRFIDFSPLDEALTENLVDCAMAAIIEESRPFSAEASDFLALYAAVTGVSVTASTASQLLEAILLKELELRPHSRTVFRRRGGISRVLDALSRRPQQSDHAKILAVATLDVQSQREVAATPDSAAADLTTFLRNCELQQHALEAGVRAALNICHMRAPAARNFVSAGAIPVLLELCDAHCHTDLAILALNLIMSLYFSTDLQLTVSDMPPILKEMTGGGPSMGYGAILLGLVHWKQPDLYESIRFTPSAHVIDLINDFSDFLRAKRTLHDDMAQICSIAAGSFNTVPYRLLYRASHCPKCSEALQTMDTAPDKDPTSQGGKK